MRCDGLGYIVNNLLYADYLQITRGEVNSFWLWLLKNIFRSNMSAYVIFFRLSSCSNPIINFLSKLRYKRLSKNFHIDIPVGVQIGGGLYLGHFMCIVINKGTKIGRNCNIFQFVNIGTNHNNYATIGDNVYIGPMVCIVEGVKIGNNVTIGAGSVVTHSIPDNATVAGVPAKVLNFNNPGRYIFNK